MPLCRAYRKFRQRGPRRRGQARCHEGFCHGRLDSLSLCTVLALASFGCEFSPKNIGEGEGTESSADGAADSSSDSESSPGTDDAADDGSGDETDSSTATESSPETDTGEFPAECADAAAPPIPGFELDFHGWPPPDPDTQIAAGDWSGTCEVTQLSEDEGVIASELACDEGGPSTISLALHSAEFAAPWAVGETVDIETSVNVYVGHAALAMRRPSDGALLVSLARGGTYPEGEGPVGTPPLPNPSAFAPLELTLELDYCGYEYDGLGSKLIPFRLIVSEPGADTASMLSGDEVDFEGSEASYHLRLDNATGNYCCHFSEHLFFSALRTSP